MVIYRIVHLKKKYIPQFYQHYCFTFWSILNFEFLLHHYKNVSIFELLVMLFYDQLYYI